MDNFDVNRMPGLDAAKFNEQQYKLGYLQALVECGDITSHSELAQVASRIDASPKVFGMVQDWATREMVL